MDESGWIIENQTVVRYKGHERDLVIPSGITHIGEGAFANHKELLSVQLPDGLLEIGNKAFERCERLGNMVIPAGVKSIGSNAFYACYTLSDLSLPDSVTWIGDSVFWGCTHLQSVRLPRSLKEIGLSLFKMCLRLKRLDLPDGITKIGRWAFSDCECLTEVAIPEGVTVLSDHVFSGCKSLISIRIPSRVIKIGEWAFSGCAALNTMVIPELVSTIGEWAFKGCVGIETIDIPASVQHIGANAFHLCKGLRAIEVSEHNTCYTSQEGVLFNQDLSILIRFPVADPLTNYAVPQGVTRIFDRAFSDCQRLESVTLPESVRYVGESAFENCMNLKHLFLGHQLPQIKEETFRNCTQLRLVFPMEAFHGQDLMALMERFADHPELLVFPFTQVWNRLSAANLEALKNALTYDGKMISIRYHLYHKLFDVVDTIEEKNDIALLRLSGNGPLSQMNQNIYRLYLQNNLKKAVSCFIARKDTQSMVRLIETGLITAVNVDSWIEMANTARCAEIVAMLLQFKFQHSEFKEDTYTF